jgi:5-methylcytosine-specific restriction protein A
MASGDRSRRDGRRSGGKVVAKVGRAKPFTAADRLANTGSSQVLKQGSRWQKVREMWLKDHPLCTMCQSIGTLTPATVVDHVIPHRNSPALMWDSTNYQSLCAHHHNSTKQHHEKAGVYGCDADGFPIDPSSHWNRDGK